MLTATDILECLRRQPFEPFRVVMSSGERYDVRHPDMCMVLGPNKIHVGIPRPGTDDVAVQVAQCAILHVVSLEPLNGRPPKAKAKARRKGK